MKTKLLLGLALGLIGYCRAGEMAADATNSAAENSQAPAAADRLEKQFAQSVRMNNIEVELGQQLFPPTNTVGFTRFEQLVFDSLTTNGNMPQGMSFQQITFVFHYPGTNGRLESFTQMDDTDYLLYSGGHVTRKDSPRKIPFSRIRLADSEAKDLTAEVNVLVGLWPLNDPQAIRYFRRSFWFEHHQDHWQQVTHTHRFTRKS